MNEMLLTALLVIICVWYAVRRTIPLLLEWLECMSMDDTTTGKEDGGDEDL